MLCAVCLSLLCVVCFVNLDDRVVFMEVVTDPSTRIGLLGRVMKFQEWLILKILKRHIKTSPVEYFNIVWCFMRKKKVRIYSHKIRIVAITDTHNPCSRLYCSRRVSGGIFRPHTTSTKRWKFPLGSHCTTLFYTEDTKRPTQRLIPC